MKRKILFILLSYYQVINSTKAQTVEWAQSLSCASYVTSTNNIINDNNGNVIITGQCAGSNTAYLIKYDQNGAKLWGKSFTTAFSIGTVSIDQQNNIYAVIGTCGNCDLEIEGQIFRGGVLAKYNSNGILQWAYHPHHGIMLGKRFNDDNTLMVLGWFQDTVTLKGNVFLQTTNPNGCYFIAMMDVNGDFLWAIPDEGGYRIYHSTDTAFFVTGSIYTTSITLGKNANQVTLYSANGMSYFAKYNIVGELEWTKQLHSTLIAPDEFGNAYIFDTDSTNIMAIYLKKYDHAGSLIWKKTHIYINDWYKAQMQCGTNGDVYLSGGFKNYMTIDDSVINGGPDYRMFLAKIDSSGALRWITTSSGSGGAGAKDISVSGKEIFITGDMGGQNTFGSYTLNEPNGGVFTLKITDDETQPLSLNEVVPSISALNVYPNPSGNIFNVFYSGRFLHATINIRNQLGQLIITKKYSSRNELHETFDLSEQAQGVYFIELITGEAREVKKIIVE